MELFYHPLSRYSQKVLVAFYEKQANFYPRVIDVKDPYSRNAFKQQYPLGKLPLLKTPSGKLLPESSIIIEYIDHQFATGTQLIPADFEHALQVRLCDRIIDNDISNKLYMIEKMQMRAEQTPLKIKQLENDIVASLSSLNEQLGHYHWLCGDAFTMADCALIPSIIDVRKRFKLYQFDQLNRYLHQAENRGSWMQVQQEIELAKTSAQGGFRPIP